MTTTKLSKPPAAPATTLEEALSRGRSLRRRLMSLPAVAKSVRAVVVVASGLRGESITLRAAALTYLTLLSIVPLLAVVFSVFQAVVGTKVLEDQLQEYILDNLAVGARASFQTYIEQYVQRATGATLGGFGFVFLLVSAVSLLANVEKAFNHIFRAPRPRPLALRFGIYWCLLTLGPILLSLSIAGTALIEGSRALGPLRHVAGVLLPLLVTCGAFTLLYLILPAVQVKRRAAMLGAFVAGTAWEAAKVAYATLSSHSIQRDKIYGSLSAIPTFLLWTYVSWLIVLFGARVAYAAQATSLGLAVDATAGPLVRELLVARVMRVVAQAFRDGTVPPGVRVISTDLSADEALVRAALEDLADRELVREAAQGGWSPARPLDQIRLREVRAAARGEVERPGEHGLPLPADVTLLLVHWDRADDAAGQRLGASYAELTTAPGEASEHVTDPVPVRA